MEPIVFTAGLVCLGLVFWDVFGTIMVPRPTRSPLRIARHLTRWTWRAWRAIGMRTRTGLSRDLFFGVFAPGAIVLLLVAWMVVLVLGYGLIFFALRGDLRPVPSDLMTAVYFAGTSVLTLGYGDVVAAGPLVQLVALIAAASGLGIVALVITFLFSLFGFYQRREALVVTLASRAKSPPSAVTLLETYARLDLVAELPALFADWERWEAEVLDSHVAFPLLAYFRSSHDNVSWISALGAVLDAAALVLTTIRDVPRGQAELTKRGGAHLVEDISNYFHLLGDGSRVDRAEFNEAYARLAEAGYALEEPDTAWPAFESARATYAGRLEALARHWAMSSALWVGERTPAVSAVHRVKAPATTRQ